MLDTSAWTPDETNDLEVHQKFSTVHHFFNSLLSVSSGDENIHPIFFNLQSVSILAMESQTRL